MKLLVAITVLSGSVLLNHSYAEEAQAKSAETQKTVTVGGHVRRPGPVALTKTSTLYEVVQNAGGATEFGAVGRVKVFRDGKLHATYNLKEDAQKMTKVVAGDTIEVPQKNLFGR